MMHRWWQGCVLPLVAFLMSFTAVTCFDHALADYRYPYAVDSASYVDMARSWRAVGQPLVTPWDVDQGPDAIPQVLFPPGFAAVIAALTPWAGNELRAAQWPSRWAAVLLPVIILLLFRGAVSDRALLWVATVAVLTPGVREWHYMAYSDVPALLLAVGALGCLARGVAWVGAASRWRGVWLFFAGTLAGVSYTVRNASLAVLFASALVLVYAACRERRVRWDSAWWMVGAAPWVLALWIYNLRTFGHLQPYVMPPSTRSWAANVGDYGVSQLADLGIPSHWLNPLCATLLLLILVAALAYRGWQLKSQAKRQGMLVLVAVFTLCGATMLVVSRSRYEWGGFIDARYTLQYAWAVALAIALWAADVQRPIVQWLCRALAMAVLGMLLLAAVQDVTRWQGWGAQSWLILSKDPAVRIAVQAMPSDTLMASNAAAFLRLDAKRAVREIEVGGTDADFVATLAQAAVMAGSRPITFFLVCDEFVGQVSTCKGDAARVVPGLPCRIIRQMPPVVAVCESVTPRAVTEVEGVRDGGH